MSDKHECDEEWTSESAWDTIERMSELKDDEPIEFDRSVYNNPK